MASRRSAAAAILLLLALAVPAVMAASSTPAHSKSKKGKVTCPNVEACSIATTAFVDAAITASEQETDAHWTKYLQPFYGQAVSVLSADGQSCTSTVTEGGDQGVVASCAVNPSNTVPVMAATLKCPPKYFLAVEDECAGAVIETNPLRAVLLPIIGTGATGNNAAQTPQTICAVDITGAGPVPQGAALVITQSITCIYDTSVVTGSARVAKAARAAVPASTEATYAAAIAQALGQSA